MPSAIGRYRGASALTPVSDDSAVSCPSGLSFTRLAGRTVQVSRSGPGYTDSASQSPSYGCCGASAFWADSGDPVSRAGRGGPASRESRGDSASRPDGGGPASGADSGVPLPWADGGDSAFWADSGGPAFRA